LVQNTARQHAAVLGNYHPQRGRDVRPDAQCRSWIRRARRIGGVPQLQRLAVASAGVRSAVDKQPRIGVVVGDRAGTSPVAVAHGVAVAGAGDVSVATGGEVGVRGGSSVGVAIWNGVAVGVGVTVGVLAGGAVGYAVSVAVGSCCGVLLGVAGGNGVSLAVGA